jgi:hypothetical protein
VRGILGGRMPSWGSAFPGGCQRGLAKENTESRHRLWADNKGLTGGVVGEGAPPQGLFSINSLNSGRCPGLWGFAPLGLGLPWGGVIEA